MATSTQNPDGSQTLAAETTPVVNSAFQPGSIGPGNTPTTEVPTPPTEAPVASQTPSGTTPPATDLKPGSQGQDVEALQNYLVQMGYLKPDQVTGGEGTYGPNTTAAVAKLQQDLGVQAGSASGNYGPQTQQALAQKYGNIFSSVQKTNPTDSASAANTTIQSVSQQSTDPVFGAMASSLGPIMESLNQVLQNINNPALTATSLQSEYNTLAQQNNLPGLQSSLMNMQNVMNGTTDDIRNEITSAGGFATESQVQGMASARNNVILKQYNALATQYQAAQTNVSNMMQYATTDQQTALQRQQAAASVTESMASIENQMMNMGITMQQNAKQAVQYNVTQTGYTALAASAQGNPQTLANYENLLGLSPGTLSDPNALASLDTYKEQQLAISQENAQNAAQRTVVYAYNAGMGVGGTQAPITPNPGGGASITAPVPTTSLVRPSWLPSAVPLSMSSTQMQQYVKASGASIDPGTNNIVAPNIGYYIQQSDGSYVLNSAIPTPVAADSVTGQYQQMLGAMQQSQATPVGGSPLNKGRLSRNANTALKNYITSPVYQAVSSGATYLSRIQAAMTDPGSISDTSLADAIIKIETGGGQVTESQINTYFSGQSYADKFAVQGDKITAKGGVLSPQQRTDLAGLANEVFSRYQQQYEQLYVQAGQNLEGQGIPINYLGNLPDFSALLQGQTATTQ